MRVLVTGGAGFIGSHLVEHHLGKGDKVCAIDNLSTGSIKNIFPFIKNPYFRFIEADVLTYPSLHTIVKWADRIYHMAAVVGVNMVLAEPTKTLATNVAGCERLLRAAQAGGWNPQILIASTSEVYGLNDFDADGLSEDANLILGLGSGSRGSYMVSKLADEVFGLAYAKKFNLQVVVVRLFNTIGPRQTGRYGMVIPRFVEQAVTGKPITVYGDGKQTRSFCDVRDTVIALDRLLCNLASIGEIVNVGNDREISILELAELVRQRARSSSLIKFVPYEEAYGEDSEDTRRRKPYLEKLCRLTQFKPKWTLEETLDYLIEDKRQSNLELRKQEV